MKNLKLIFGVLMVAAFVGATILTYTVNNQQAIKKSEFVIPHNG